MKMKRIGTICCLILLGVFTLVNRRQVAEPLRNEWTTFTESIGKNFNSDALLGKKAMVHLNGLWGKLTARRRVNDVYLMKNGMLTQQFGHIVNLQDKATNILTLNNHCESLGSEFIFIMFPYKLDMNGDLLPDGVRDPVHEDSRTLIASLEHERVSVIDTVPLLVSSAEDLEKYFYKTDHHWKPQGAFKAFQIIMAELKRIIPDLVIPEETMSKDNWTVHSLPNVFLGSRGKRTGRFFAGMEDLYWMTPNFENQFSCSVPDKDRFFKGNYAEAFIRERYLDPDPDPMETNQYYIYIGGDYPYVSQLNEDAANDMKVLVVKDSFSISLQTFYSTIFREVDVLDPRYYSVCSIAEMIRQLNPDLVLFEINENYLHGNEYFQHVQISDWDNSDDHTVEIDETIIISETDSVNHFIDSHAELTYDTPYTLTVPRIRVDEGGAEAVSVKLYDTKTKKVENSMIFDIEHCDLTGDCSWTFRTPKADVSGLQLIFYAGLPGQTEGVGVTYEGVSLRTGYPD